MDSSPKLQQKIINQQHAAHNLQVAHNKLIGRYKRKREEAEALREFLLTASYQELNEWRLKQECEIQEKRERALAARALRGLPIGAQARILNQMANMALDKMVEDIFLSSRPEVVVGSRTRGVQGFAKDIKVDLNEQAR